MFPDLEECHPLLLKLSSPWKVEYPLDTSLEKEENS